MWRVRHTLNGVDCTLLILLIKVPQCLAHHESKLDLIVHVHAPRAQHRSFIWQ